MTRLLAERGAIEMHWSGRVLTWEDLRPHLGVLRELVVGERTIVSPLVLDALRERKIALRRGEGGAGKDKTGSVGAGYAMFAVDALAQSALQSLQKEGLMLEAWQPVGANLPAWAWSMSLLVKERGRRGLALASDAALVAAIAAKVPGVRSAQVLSAAQARRSIGALGANLLAIEVPGPTFFELKQLLRAAATPPPEMSLDVERIFRELDGHAHR